MADECKHVYSCFPPQLWREKLYEFSIICKSRGREKESSCLSTFSALTGQLSDFCLTLISTKKNFLVWFFCLRLLYWLPSGKTTLPDSKVLSRKATDIGKLAPTKGVLFQHTWIKTQTFLQLSGRLLTLVLHCLYFLKTD